MRNRLAACGLGLAVLALLLTIPIEAGFSLPVTAGSLPVSASAQDRDTLSGPVATFSILGFDPATG